MSNYHYGQAHYSNMPSHNSHGSHGNHGRNRRGPRVASQNAHRHYKVQRSPKEVPEVPSYSDYLQRLEAAKSFEFDDDELFCPFHLLTEDDVRLIATYTHANGTDTSQLQSIHSASYSDRGSLSSGSPESSPLQQQVQPTPSFLLSSASSSFTPTPVSAIGFQSQSMKLHQPMAQRSRNAIPIVDPSTRSVASPPLSVSPARMQQQYMQRRW